MAHPEHAFARLTDDRERLDQQRIHGLALGEPLAEGDGLRRQLLVGERGGGRFERVDPVRGLPEPDDLALVAVEERLEKSHTSV